MNRLKIVISLFLVLLLPNLMAQPLIKYSNGNPKIEINNKLILDQLAHTVKIIEFNLWKEENLF